MILRYDIARKYAIEEGFTLFGVARARVLEEYGPRYGEALAKSGDGALRYLARGWERRLDPGSFLKGARSVAVFAVNYRNPRSGGYGAHFRAPKVASYALTDEYQPTIRAMLGRVLERLRGDFPGVEGRAASDTAAILEKGWAVEAGLGFVGRNSLLINPVYGSFLLLGELVLDALFDRYDTPYEGGGCGECRRCVEDCPAGALVCTGGGRVCAVDTRRCVSALTVERGSEPPAPECLHGWMFGCDECQSLCPWNRRRPSVGNPLFAPRWDPADFPRERWLEMSEGEFGRLFSSSPLARAGLEKIKNATRG